MEANQRKALNKLISVLVVYYPEDVRALLSKYGVSVTPNTEQIGIAVSETLGKPGFNKDIARLAIDKSNVVVGKYNAAEGTGSAILGVVSAIAGGITNVFKSVFGDGSEERTDLVKDIMATERERERTRQRQALIYGGVGITILLIGGIIIASTIKKQ